MAESGDFFVPAVVLQSVQKLFPFTDTEGAENYITNKVFQLVDCYKTPATESASASAAPPPTPNKKCWDAGDVQAFYIVCVNNALTKPEAEAALPHLQTWQSSGLCDKQGPLFRKMFDQWSPLLYHCFMRSNDDSFLRWLRAYVDILSSKERDILSQIFDVTLHGDDLNRFPKDLVGGLQEIATLHATAGCKRFRNNAEKRLLQVRSLFNKLAN